MSEAYKTIAQLPAAQASWVGAKPRVSTPERRPSWTSSRRRASSWAMVAAKAASGASAPFAFPLKARARPLGLKKRTKASRSAFT